MLVGIVGWRGMVGSVLMQRMHQESDFKNLDPVFFSTSQVGQNFICENHFICEEMSFCNLATSAIALSAAAET